MNQVFNRSIGDLVTLVLSVKQDSIGITGLAGRVALRDASNNKYLDWSDNVWKVSGWVQKYQSLVEFDYGQYQYIWNSWLSVKQAMVVIAEYEVTTVGEEARSEDTLIFGLVEVVESGRWKIKDNQMIFYALDGITPLLTFNLFDAIGLPSEVNVKERVKV